MVHLKSSFKLLLFVATVACVPDWASGTPLQQVDASVEQVKNPPASAPQPHPFPFAIGSRDSEYAHSIQVVSAGEMSQHDRDLEADAESSIQERAGFQSLGFNQEDWTYQQLVCPQVLFALVPGAHRTSDDCRFQSHSG